jgi:hypothetical protein
VTCSSGHSFVLIPSCKVGKFSYCGQLLNLWSTDRPTLLSRQEIPFSIYAAAAFVHKPATLRYRPSYYYVRERG